MEQEDTGMIDTGDAPEMYASGLLGYSFDGPNVHLMFASNRVRQDKKPFTSTPTVTLRLVLPREGLDAMLKFLGDNLNGPKNVPIQVPASTTVQ